MSINLVTFLLFGKLYSLSSMVKSFCIMNRLCLQLLFRTLRHVSSLIDKSHNEMLTWVKADQGRTPVSMGE